MFDFGFDDHEDLTESGRLQELVESYEQSAGDVYLDSDMLEDVATYYFENGRFDSAFWLRILFHPTRGFVAVSCSTISRDTKRPFMHTVAPWI